MSMFDLHWYVSILYVVWFVALFVAIVAWAFRPSRRKVMDDHADIPLRDA
ncbi:MAG: cbb3-type cytochrome oxidase subunit 3 [Rhodospirillales bacterium]|jgi:cbb3-type cytochrome oxidase subunit 3